MLKNRHCDVCSPPLLMSQVLMLIVKALYNTMTNEESLKNVILIERCYLSTTESKIFLLFFVRPNAQRTTENIYELCLCGVCVSFLQITFLFV